tara:strand:+ start:930 stop:1586 length:657 start_codon:yes stop_codon:yes gene_type:complete
MKAYIAKVARVYSLSEKDLMDLYENADSSLVENGERAKLMKLKIKELKVKCKELNHPVSGKKAELVKRILSGKRENKSKKKTTIKPTVAPTANEISLSKNDNGNYTYDGLVFDKSTRMVIGSEGSDGSVVPMTKTDIEKCHRYKLKFVIPMNLDTIKEAKSDFESESDSEEVNDVSDDEEDEEEEEADSVCGDETQAEDETQVDEVDDDAVEFVYEDE